MDLDNALRTIQKSFKESSRQFELIAKEITIYKKTIDDLKNERKVLKKENMRLQKDLEAKEEIIENQERKLEMDGKVNKDYNVLNSRLNEVIKENATLKNQMEEQGYKKRLPLASVKLENSQSSILNMLNKASSTKGTSTNKSIRQQESKNHIISPSKTTIQNNNISSSQNQYRDSQSSEVVPTQFTMEGDESETSNHNISKLHGETYHHEDNVPLFDDTIDFRAPILSSPTLFKGSHELEELKSSSSQSRQGAIRIKKEQSDDSIEILDSQEEIDAMFNTKYPTPKTATKFQTPLGIPKKLDFKKSLLQTPNDITPMKNMKKQKLNLPLPKPHNGSITSASFKISRGKNTKLDLSYHPDKDREWYYEDFKINPLKNQNLDYAYEVVLRGEAPKCVHGQTCKDCENFYKVAQGDKIKHHDFGLDWNKETRRENQRKKPNLVATASRHRSVWERVESPPGFRDFDFPDTQQQLKNREKSNKLRLKKAYERLFSAINQGKFMFREEKFNEAVQERNFIIDQSVFEKYINFNIDEEDD